MTALRTLFSVDAVRMGEKYNVCNFWGREALKFGHMF
jgi:hypothetical protein